MPYYLILIAICCCVGLHDTADAAQTEYMSLRSGKVNMRVGPGKMHPILWTYTARGLPLKVIAKHHEWVQVQDKEGETGWIYSRLLSTVRTAMSNSHNVLVHTHPDNNASVIAKMARHVVVLPVTCRITWCNVNIPYAGDTVSGWVRKQYLWGVESADLFEE